MNPHPKLTKKTSSTSQMSASFSATDTSFTRWLEKNGLGDYATPMAELDIHSLDALLQSTHPQLIEIGRQLGMKPVASVMFAEKVVANPGYAQRHTVNESGDVEKTYKLVHLVAKLKRMGLRDNWDMATDDIYALMDNSPNQRQLIGLLLHTHKFHFHFCLFFCFLFFL